jgi:hypothetical protein
MFPNNKPTTVRLKKKKSRALSNSIAKFNQLMKVRTPNVYQAPVEDLAPAPQQKDEYDELAEMFKKM